MPSLTLRDLPQGLHSWLKQRAATHHRPIDREVIALLQEAQGGLRSPAPRATAEEIMEISRRAGALPRCDFRHEDEILGYGSDGLPG